MSAHPRQPDEFSAVHDATRRIVRKAHATVRQANRNLERWIDEVASAAPAGKDIAYATSHAAHSFSFVRRLEHVNELALGLEQLLASLEVLTRHEVFYPVPVTVITRALLENVTMTLWTLDPSESAEVRAIRGYATAFRMLQQTLDALDTGEQRDEVNARRDLLIGELRKIGVRVNPAYDRKTNEPLDKIASIGKRKEKASVDFRISDRIRTYLPPVAPLYRTLSSVSHGELLGLAVTSASVPKKTATAAGVVALTVTEWSRTVNTWAGRDAPRPPLKEELTSISDILWPRPPTPSLGAPINAIMSTSGRK